MCLSWNGDLCAVGEAPLSAQQPWADRHVRTSYTYPIPPYRHTGPSHHSCAARCSSPFKGQSRAQTKTTKAQRWRPSLVKQPRGSTQHTPLPKSSSVARTRDGARWCGGTECDSELLLHGIDGTCQLLALRLLDSTREPRRTGFMDAARELRRQSLEGTRHLAHQLLLCRQLRDCLDALRVEQLALEHATQNRVVLLLHTLDKVVPHLHALADLCLGREHPVVGVR
mmetsp:Transcript_71888/g.159898  ORF Transcript_71888/g.159898 Transcript_71888/m.159898 type:complete len:226 (-) Transcript_71888:362-1039(-)